MRHILFFNYILFFLTFGLFGQESSLFLKERFRSAQTGAYIVFEQNKMYTLLNIYDKTNSSLVIEEVSAPTNRLPKNISFRQWFEEGAQGSTSWIMSQIDLESGQILQSYSFTRKGWLDVSNVSSFLTTLLNLRFVKISDEERKKIGPPPRYGQLDQRRLWNPRLVLDGKIIPQVPFSAWKARWPNDNTELSRKKIEIYLPELGNDDLPYPSYFPYWIEVEGKLGCAQVRVIDSGFNVISPQPPIYKTY